MPAGPGRLADYGDQVAEVWARDLYDEAEKATFWGPFEGGEGSSMPIIRKDDLSKGPNDTLHYDLALKLEGTGSQVDSATDSTFSTEATLTEGREEKVQFTQIDLKLASIRHAVRWNWLADRFITHDMRATGLRKLASWLSGKIDDRVFAELVGAGTTTMPAAQRLGVTAASTVTASMTDGTYVDADTALDLDSITKTKAYALSTLDIEPIRVGASPMFGLVVHPLVEATLKVSDDYQQAMREAQVRGDSNPLFSGASAVWDGVIIYVSSRVPAASTSNVYKNIFFGAQAMCRGWAVYPTWREQEFSYGEEMGIATRCVLGEKLNVFDLSVAQNGSGNRAIGNLVLASLAAPVVS